MNDVTLSLLRLGRLVASRMLYAPANSISARYLHQSSHPLDGRLDLVFIEKNNIEHPAHPAHRHKGHWMIWTFSSAASHPDKAGKYALPSTVCSTSSLPKMSRKPISLDLKYTQSNIHFGTRVQYLNRKVESTIVLYLLLIQ